MPPHTCTCQEGPTCPAYAGVANQLLGFLQSKQAAHLTLARQRTCSLSSGPDYMGGSVQMIVHVYMHISSSS